jgi:hypothetical protein
MSSKNRMKKLEAILMNAGADQEDIYIVSDTGEGYIEKMYGGTKIKGTNGSEKLIYYPERFTHKIYDENMKEVERESFAI